MSKANESNIGSSKKDAAPAAVVLPGDFLATPEEFLPGSNAYEQGDSVRASIQGHVQKDLSKREVGVKPVVVAMMPSVGDVVLGRIEAAMTSTAGMRITYLNGVPRLAGFSGTIFMRPERGGRGMRRTYVKLGDIVRAKVGSTLNGMIQLSIDEPHLGVLFSACSVCGTPLLRGDTRAKCENCGNVEERKFADDFGRGTIQP
ncbi:MAG: exosome complex RNA-binding protein Csl4 [Thaumarchaeota archaeon]|nr:exosome complex RNA-binding protein Csl4 [Nitrososphaerota archaeon]